MIRQSGLEFRKKWYLKNLGVFNILGFRNSSLSGARGGGARCGGARGGGARGGGARGGGARAGAMAPRPPGCVEPRLLASLSLNLRQKHTLEVALQQSSPQIKPRSAAPWLYKFCTSPRAGNAKV